MTTPSRLWLLFPFLLLLLTNIRPIGDKIYIQFLWLLIFVLLYSLAVLLDHRLYCIDKSMVVALFFLGLSVFASIFLYKTTLPGLQMMVKYALFLMSFPVFISLFQKMPDISKYRATMFYVVLVLVFTLVTEWQSILHFTKPSMTFLGGYNGGNLHFLAILIFLLTQVFSGVSRKKRLLSFSLLFAFLILMAVTQSRQAVLLFVFTMAYFFWSARGRIRLKFWHVLSMLALFVAFGLLAFATGIFDRFIFEAQGFSDNSPVSTVDRYVMLAQFFQALNWTTLFLGQGFGAQVIKFEGPSFSIHNGILQPIFNGGVLLFIACSVAYGHFLKRFSRPGSPKRIFLLCYLAANLFDSHLISFQVLWLPALMIALLPEAVSLIKEENVNFQDPVFT